MGGEEVTGKNEQNNVHSQVTSVGNSWIICRSKSHSGRIYYFNTLTGEAAWNLSDPEIEKAKRRMNILEGQSGVAFENCPEPKEPPVDISTSINKETEASKLFVPSSRIYNKQIINNQFSKQSYVAHCNNCNSLVPQTALSGMEVNMGAPHFCKPNVWPVLPNHQVLIAPVQSPVVNECQTPINIPYDVRDQHISVQNTSLPLSRRFNLLPEIKPNGNVLRHGTNKFSPRSNYNTQSQYRGNTPYYNKLNNNVSHKDLRQKLSARRCFNWNKSIENNYQQDGENSGITEKMYTQKIKIIKPEIEAVSQSEVDDVWLKENATVQGTQLLLNVDPLKELVTSGQACAWYVVADTIVMLNNINLLNVIVHSGNQCQLMVPDYIMEELQYKSRQHNTQLMSRAHYVLQILSKQFATGCAVIGKDLSNDSNKLKILDFCCKLSEQDQCVVLVSNNIQLGKYKNTCNFPILSTTELKELLTKTSFKPVTNVINPFKNMKITIPNDNDLVTLSEEKQSNDSNILTAGNSQCRKITNSVSTQIDECFKITSATLCTKNTADVAVQTDLVSMHANGLYSQKVDRSTNTESSQSDGLFNDDGNDNKIKRRGIQLKRNLSYQMAMENNIEKRQFKWRRKKQNVSDAHNDISEKSAQASHSPIKEDERVDNQSTVNCISNVEMLNHESTNICCDEPNNSSETDSSCYIQKNTINSIVIEETSTSGISNTASNIDSESLHSVKPIEHLFINPKNVIEDKHKWKCAMFEVKSSVMEEYLKIKCDEWVSRFVQIMEEVLTQILQQDPPFFNRTLPPPWTLHEATECVKNKFRYDSDVTDAGNKLNCVLFKISDGRGKIKRELEPADFMEMYSYGVYLVDSLQGILSSCEDLQTAADSLAKLLNDIENPNLDTSHVDSFMEISEVSDANDTHLDIENEDCMSQCEKEIMNSEILQNENSPICSSFSHSNPKKYNLRSGLKQLAKDYEEKEKVVKFIRNIDVESTFFTSLNLQKNSILLSNKKKSCALMNNKEILSPSKLQTSSDPKFNKESQDNTLNNEPKIIRNFSKCLEFEEKLKKKENYIEEACYYEDIEENETDDYEYYDEDYKYGYDYDDEEPVEQNQANSIFDQIFGKLINEVQEALLEVRSFCDKTQEELRAMPNISSPKKLEIRDKAEKARSHMDVLCKTLNGILCREDTDCDKNIQAVLKEAGIPFDITKSEEYRNVVSKYTHQAKILLEAVNIVIEALDYTT